MKLYEYMGKEILRREGIPVPRGRVFFSPAGVAEFVAGWSAAVVKSQVLTGGRGKAGGIRLTASPAEAEAAAAELLSTVIKDLPVQAVLVEEKLQIEQEYYVAVTVDGAGRRPLVIASAQGGVDIEEVAEEHLVKLHVDVHAGLQPYFGREVAGKMGLPPEQAGPFAQLLVKLYRLFRTYEAELVEINPLVVCGNTLVAADAKITIDDEALFRLPEWLPRVEERTAKERQAAEIGISFVELAGDIGVMANGAGITMATLDMIHHYGGNPRNFMDAGGGAGTEATARALEILLSTNPKAVLVNIFGGITRCDDVARAFAQVKNTAGIPVPLVVRLVGTNEEAGQEILKQHGINVYRTAQEAVARVVQLAAGKEAV
ncbi:ADP-forming succinate--CoA ligase subunit beta [Desulforamulus hydrothermalis]|uniref:Succinate--CoA ligase [ADP-forming] subunit beta n=1 Tax=Desulforamulus hydrothermalis Lam5 = DSM 18033 TaxID=1121428 RepID=K8EEB6_9FIRM|nr:ADP-forming succinate--CoA ligase subunit beta [Desulforamulus hydrothermalis]CCO07136.1 Succinyl-CoA ligase (ADP-forming) subunit beta [Desulforamulus hydrothermalis Lam5 = DSM 18033]SHG89300.1 succinyl-CoA synthetase beta subunit [Desulforamulus hydrothermalis Lam5 = DSM 18033]